MENALHRFVRLLRLRQVRISIPEALDAMACAREPGMLSDKAHPSRLVLPVVPNDRNRRTQHAACDTLIREPCR